MPNNMLLAIVGDVTSEEAFAQAERVFGGWPRGEVPPMEADRSAAADTPRDRGGQARRGADGDTRRPAGDSAQAPGLPGVGSRPSRSSAARARTAASRSAVRARPHLRRRGRHAGDEAGRRLRRRNEYADRDHRRSPAPDRRRDSPSCSGSVSSSASSPTPRPIWPAAFR